MSATSTAARHHTQPLVGGAAAAIESAMNGGAGGSASAATSTTGTSQSGPPYFCPTCQTSYSRLEYLRRHERRHADIRPFVCDCGKGFSRSDVLSRHKRQCAVVLNGGESADSSANRSSTTNGAGSNKRRASSSASTTASAASSAPARRKSSTSRGGGVAGKATATKARKSRSGQSDSLHPTPDDDDDDDDGVGSHSPPFARPGSTSHQNAHMSQAHPHIHPHAHHHASGLPSNVQMSSNSFPFPPQPGVQQHAQTVPPPPLLPPAPYASDGTSLAAGAPGAHAIAAGGGGGANGQTTNSPFGAMMPHHLNAFNNMVSTQQHHYPSSPESNGTMSQHGSPRFTSRDMVRHGSNGSRSFSLCKGGSFDHIGPRGTSGMMHGTTPNQYAPEFWDALDPAAKNASSMAGSDYISAGAAVGLGDSSGVGGPAGLAGLNGGGVTTPRGGEPQRFSVSTGPLSPFSSMALTSTMSPYLSAFSNARDTPFVASPSRGLIPGTPGSSLNVFDWTMRPPSKPASSIMAKRDSLSQQGAGASTSSNGWQSGTTASSSTTTNTSPSSLGGNKRKREDEDTGRGSPKAEDASDTQDLDDDHRSAAELLDSLRTAGVRPAVHTPGATDASSSVAPHLGSTPAPAYSTSSSATSTAPAIVSSSVDDTSSASALAAVSAAADAAAIHAIAEAAHTSSTDSQASRLSGAGSVSRASDKAGVSAGQVTTSTTAAPTAADASSPPPPPGPSTTSPPPHNLTLSQLPVTSSPPLNSAASLAQSSWEALMKGNGWGKSLGNGEQAAGAADSSPSKLTAQRPAQTVGDDSRSRQS